VYLALMSWLVWQIPPEVGSAGSIIAIITVWAIFFVPATLFGTVTPLGITLVSERKTAKQVSSISGAMYGISTAANILGVSAAAFYLIPYVGLTLTLRIFALGLVVFAVYFWLRFRASGASEDAKATNDADSKALLKVLGEAIDVRDTKTIAVLALVVFTGIISLATEIIAPRLFTSLFGPTTILWATVISISLLGLTLGYFIGGVVPAKWASRVLVVILLANAGLLLLTSWIIWELPSEFTTIDLNAVVITAVASLLGPFILFGMVPQLAITILSDGKTKAQATTIVGMVFSIETIGSIVGALSAALIFIPDVGLSPSIKIFAAGLALASLYFLPLRLKPIGIVMLALVILAPQPDWHWSTGQLRLVTQREGYYQTIRIYTDDETFIRLHLGPTYESQMDLTTLQPQFGYARTMVGLTEDVEGKNILSIGGSGHSMARSLEMRGATVTEVEIDPIVVEVSDEFFGPIEGDVIVQDGRAFVEQADANSYDYVLVDAFNGPASVPAQLTTVEFFEAVSRVLTDDGQLIMNFIGQTTGDQSGSFVAVAASVSAAFEDARYLGSSGNIIFIASNTPVESAQTLPFAPPDGQVLTDDLNPIEILLEEARGGGFRYQK
jgi:spermidine synthase